MSILPVAPSPVLNSLGPIYVYPNYYTEVQIPRDLFKNTDNPTQKFLVNNWIDNSANIGLRVSDEEGGDKVLFVEAFENKGCKISISFYSSYCQSSEVLVDVVVLKWASQDCTKCKGPYQNDWLQWKQGYELSSDGVCTASVSYFPCTSLTFFSILGIFSWIACTISVLLSIKYGRMMLEPIVHIQSVIMLVLSSNSVGEYWIEYLSWIQYFKFDFGLISSFILNNSKICTRSCGKLANLKLYYEETIWNYFSLVILALFVFIFLIIIQCWRQKANKFINWYSTKISSVHIFWMLWFIVWPFMAINIYFEMLTIK